MGTKTIKLPISVGIVDKANSVVDDVNDGKNGKPLIYKVVHTKHIDAGQPVTLDEEEADRLLAKFGPYDEALAKVNAPGNAVITARR